MYKFQPTQEGIQFIQRLNPFSSNEADLQELVYNQVYLACSLDIAVSRQSGVICNKRSCSDKYNCGFIPNYPVINFGNIDELPPNTIPYPQNGWIGIDNSLSFFENILHRLE